MNTLEDDIFDTYKDSLASVKAKAPSSVSPDDLMNLLLSHKPLISKQNQAKTILKALDKHSDLSLQQQILDLSIAEL